MSAGMAEVIAAHVLWMSGETQTVWQPAEESAQCSCGHEYDTWVNSAGGGEPPDWDKEHAAHVAEELAKAGYGNVQEADKQLQGATKKLRDANRKLRQLKTVVGQASLYGSVECDELDAIIDGVWSPNPDPLAAALADPEGHALVKAIHDRKAGA